MAKLDGARGRFQRGEWLRMAALDRLPPHIPALNAQAYAELGKLAANLNQGQAAINAGRASSQDQELLLRMAELVRELRLSLIEPKS